MKARERILAAVDHREADRVPVDLGATPSSGISAIAYNRLKKRLGLGGVTRVYDVVQQLAEPEEAVLARYGVDVVDVGRAFNTNEGDWYEVKLFDGSVAAYPKWFKPRATAEGGYEAWVGEKKIAVQLKGMNFFDQTCFPWLDGYPDDIAGALGEAMGLVHWAALAHSPWDRAGEAGFWEKLRANALAMREQSDRAIMIVCGCNLFEWGTFLRRLDQFLMDLACEEEKVEATLEALMTVHLETLGKVCEAVGDVADIIRFGDDLGMDTGPFMSPATYRRFFKGRHARLCRYVHEHSNMRTFLHSCGSIHALLGDLIEAGFQIINPVQTNCAMMEPERLKKEFGKDITFWGGGCDTRAVLNRAKPSEVKEHVKRRLDVLMPGGGYVFNTVHNILPDVPAENIEAMYEAVREWGD